MALVAVDRAKYKAEIDKLVEQLYGYESADGAWPYPFDKQAKPAEIWDPGTEKVNYTQDLWPYVLLGVLALFLLDIYAKRVRLFGYRTIKFQ